MVEFIKGYKVKYKILTPVHIGTGEELSPFDYVIVDNMFHRISADELISSLSDEQLRMFYSYIRVNNITSLRSLIVANFKSEKFSKYSVRVLPGVANKYRENLNNINNQLLISPFIRTPDSFKPYIPGSSIKGAIRTAIIDDIVRGKKYEKKYKPQGANWELFAMEAVEIVSSGEKKQERASISRDPFRTLKISDVFIDNEVMLIGEVLNAKVNKAKGRLDTIGIQMIKEVVSGYLNLGKPVEFEGEIRIDEFLPRVKRKDMYYGVSMPIDKDFIIKTCNYFYSQELRREMEFYEFAVDMHDIISKMKTLFNVKQNECLIRVGRFSGVYAVTINEYRNPANKKWGTTRNLFDGRYPMGWIKIEFLEEIRD
ncbi:MAG: type III-A CRISPR-associated RAMP protein Csm5 [Candidatus Kryptonium sp.]